MIFSVYLYWKANAWIAIPGSSEIIYLGVDGGSRAESAYRRAVKACDHERDNEVLEAGVDWQKIFGQQIPRTL